MSKSIRLHCIHILECIERIHHYTDHNKTLFLNDRKTYDAVIRNLQTLAESTQKFPKETKDKYPNIPWKNIAGFRNILVHDYLGDINNEHVWNIIEKYLPELEAAMHKEFPEWKIILSHRAKS